MLLIQEKTGSLPPGLQRKFIDRLELEWHETGKRIMRKKTRAGQELQLRFLNGAPALAQDDILFEDAERIIAVEIRPCHVMMLKPASPAELALACYEIGNRHLPLFYEEGTLLMAYDAPVFRMLEAAGFALARDERRLLHPLRTTVAPHGGGGLLTRILDWTNSEAP